MILYFRMSKRILFLFDVDGTLTAPRAVIKDKMLNFMISLSKRATVGIVGGSDECKIIEQLDGHNEIASYLFSENGLVAKRGEKEIGRTSIVDKIGNDRLQDFINYCLRYMANIRLPVKRGTFIEFRNGMINVCPVGRACSLEERNQFFEYDKIHKIRDKFVEDLRAEFPDLQMKYSIGGQISFDCFPIGWDKTYCLQYIENEFDDIYFYGDKTYKEGNDYEIFEDSRVKGRTTTGPDNTMELVTRDLNSLGL